MSILGLTDPWVIGAYVGCILTVVFCVAYSILKGKDSDEGDEAND